MKKYNYVVFIGRFQPPHRAHIEIMEKALSVSNHLIVLIGSSFQPRTIKNPWSWQERANMIDKSLGSPNNLTIMPLRDVIYNDQAWTKQVQTIVNTITKNDESVAIIGHAKDKTSYYLEMFPQWDLINIDNIDDIHAADIRQLYFYDQQDGEDFDNQLGPVLPAAIHDFLRAFMMRNEYDALVEEATFIRKYKQAWDSAPYQPTFVTVDAVVVQSGHILLVKRRAKPGQGLWALPGGFIDPQERIKDSVIRELREETRIKVPAPVLQGSIEKSEVYDHPERSLRGRTITHAFLIELQPGPLPKVKGSDDAEKAKWVPLSVFSQMEDQMFEDHYHIVNDMIGEL